MLVSGQFVPGLDPRDIKVCQPLVKLGGAGALESDDDPVHPSIPEHSSIARAGAVQLGHGLVLDVQPADQILDHAVVFRRMEDRTDLVGRFSEDFEEMRVARLCVEVREGRLHVRGNMGRKMGDGTVATAVRVPMRGFGVRGAGR